MDDAKQTTIARWLAKAKNDLITARTMLETDPPITDIVCFHAQQCTEKALKAFLVVADIHVEKTHYLPRLVELCSRVEPGFQKLKEAAVELTDYTVASRYSDDWRDIPLAEAIEAVRLAEMILSFIQGKIGI
jgi:HEPN domain-containing protein